VPTTTPRRPLPFEQVCEGTIDKKIIDLNTLNPNSYGEISRLAVIANFRRRAGELEVPYPLVQEGLPELGNAENERRSFPHIALGLYLSAAAIGLNLGMERAFAMMESRLARRLHIYGIHFEQIGTEVEHRGKRAPFQITKAKLYAHLNNDIRGLLDDIQKSVDAFP
jgi:N-acyl amino acid synthase of PEP-CTERM/exosortase system